MTNINEFKDPSFVEPSILAPKPKLYPKLWNKKTNKLHPDLSIKLKQIARDFVSGFVHPLRIKDIILTGSLANFNWNKFSDIDLHVVVDFNDIPEEHYDAFLDYFDAKKRLWNNKHNIMIVNHEVEIYIQDSSEPHHSTGIYSVMSDRWLREPAYEKQELDYENIINKAEFYSSAINDIVQLFIDEQYDDVLEKSELLQNKLKKFRQAGLEQKGEYSTENLVFKTLRNSGYLDKLSNVRSKAYDKKMSVEEELSIFITQQTLEEVKKKKKKKRDSCYYKAKAKYKVWPSAYASAYLVRCRKKKGKIKEELDEEFEFDEELLENSLEEDAFELDEELIEELTEQELDEKKKKSNFSKERDQGLRGWFSRVGEEGKSKGWVDCNTCRTDPDSGRKKCKSCGRQKGEKRRKYPACRPTPSQCTRSGMKRKKSSKPVSWKSKKDK